MKVIFFTFPIVKFPCIPTENEKKTIYIESTMLFIQHNTGKIQLRNMIMAAALSQND